VGNVCGRGSTGKLVTAAVRGQKRRGEPPLASGTGCAGAAPSLNLDTIMVAGAGYKLTDALDKKWRRTLKKGLGTVAGR
jgi:hypothetical protein